MTKTGIFYATATFTRLYFQLSELYSLAAQRLADFSDTKVQDGACGAKDELHADDQLFDAAFIVGCSIIRIPCCPRKSRRVDPSLGIP
jgi:hypothetical protein